MPGWDIISALSYSENLLHEEKKEMRAGKVSDEMIHEAEDWFRGNSWTWRLPKPVLIKVPTGSSKSTFIMKNLEVLL